MVSGASSILGDFGKVANSAVKTTGSTATATGKLKVYGSTEAQAAKLAKYSQQAKDGKTTNGNSIFKNPDGSFTKTKADGSKVDISAKGETGIGKLTNSSEKFTKTKTLTTGQNIDKVGNLEKAAKSGNEITTKSGQTFKVKEVQGADGQRVFKLEGTGALKGVTQTRTFGNKGAYSKEITAPSGMLRKEAGAASNVSKGSRVKAWVKEHPYWSAAIGVGTLGLGYFAYKHMSKDSSDSSSTPKEV